MPKKKSTPPLKCRDRKRKFFPAWSIEAVQVRELRADPKPCISCTEFRQIAHDFLSFVPLISLHHRSLAKHFACSRTQSFAALDHPQHALLHIQTATQKRSNKLSKHPSVFHDHPPCAILMLHLKRVDRRAGYSIIRYRVMIRSFGNKAAREIWEKEQSKTLPKSLWIRAKALMTIMHHTSTLEDLKIRGQPPNIRLHKLQGDRRGQWSVTVELPWCITFRFTSGEFLDVSIESYHKG